MPDATSLYHSLQNCHQLYNLELNSGIGHLASLPEGGCKVYGISILYTKCSTFPAAWVCGQSYANISHTPPKCA